MKLAIFGATGTVGSELLTRALDAGHDVRALVRTPSKVPGQHPRLTVVAATSEISPRSSTRLTGATPFSARSVRPTDMTPICVASAPRTSSPRCASSRSAGSW